MALIVKNLEIPDGTIIEEAYLRIQSVASANVDYEHFENLENGDQILRWIKKLESTALVYVWSDSLARENRAQVQHWFQIEFTYDLTEWVNIFEQAYTKLKSIYPEAEDC